MILEVDFIFVLLYGKYQRKYQLHEPNIEKKRDKIEFNIFRPWCTQTKLKWKAKQCLYGNNFSANHTSI